MQTEVYNIQQAVSFPTQRWFKKRLLFLQTMDAVLWLYVKTKLCKVFFMIDALSNLSKVNISLHN